MGPYGQRSLAGCGCRDGRTAGGFGRHACGPLAPGNSMMDGFLLPSPYRPPWANQRRLWCCWRAVACRSAWATCSACLGHGVARARRAGRASRLTSRSRCFCAPAPGPSDAELAPCCAGPPVTSPVIPPEGSEPGGLQRGRCAAWGQRRLRASGQAGGGGAGQLPAPPPNNSSTRGSGPVACQARRPQFKTRLCQPQSRLLGGRCGLPNTAKAGGPRSWPGCWSTPPQGRPWQDRQAAQWEGLAAVSASPTVAGGELLDQEPAARGRANDWSMIGVDIAPAEFSDAPPPPIGPTPPSPQLASLLGISIASARRRVEPAGRQGGDSRHSPPGGHGRADGWSSAAAARSRLRPARFPADRRI